MRTSVVLVAATAAGLAAAIPVANFAPKGKSIPLRKRASVGTSLAKDGVIQPGALAHHIERVERYVDGFAVRGFNLNSALIGNTHEATRPTRSKQV